MPSAPLFISWLRVWIGLVLKGTDGEEGSASVWMEVRDGCGCTADSCGTVKLSGRYRMVNMNLMRQGVASLTSAASRNHCTCATGKGSCETADITPKPCDIGSDAILHQEQVLCAHWLHKGVFAK
jgi:hypothetical protein